MEIEIEKIILAARTAHELNRVYCCALGDFSQPHWERAPKWQTDSVIHGVKAIIQHPDQTPSSSHDSWLSEKQAAGWKWGPVKDLNKKEHPCMVPYDDLPVEQRMKNTIFTAVVKGVLRIE